jgi:hypothetical protein
MWAIEVELTPKPVARTTRIMTGLLSPMRYAHPRNIARDNRSRDSKTIGHPEDLSITS